MPNEVPDWVENTPGECVYHLLMFDGRADRLQEVDLTRDEYIELKRHLAVMRGYTPGDVAAAPLRELAKELELDNDNVAIYLGIAREMCQRCPEAVICPEDTFSAVLRQLAELNAA